MIKFKTIEMTNFGPYQAPESLNFGGNDGVLVVYGDNGTGKTTIINAFRWAFTGKAKGRVGDILPDQLINRDAIKDSAGTVTATVKIEFEIGSSSFLLTRSIERERDGQAKQKLHLSEDGDVLGTAEAERRLNEILPTEIQQFFFFDGELIEQFESLLLGGSEDAHRLKSAIETILGVHILDELKFELEAASKDYAAQLSKNKKASETEKRIGELLNEKTVELSTQRNSIKSNEQTVTECEEQILDLNEKLKASSNARALMTERVQKETDLKMAEQQLEEGELVLQKCLKTSWKANLTSYFQEQTDKASKEIKTLTVERDEKARNVFLSLFQNEMHDEGKCPCCGGRPDSANHNSSGSVVFDDRNHVDRIRELEEMLSIYDVSDATSKRSDIFRNQKSVHEYQNTVSSLKSRLETIADELEDADDMEISALSKQQRNQQSILDTANGSINQSHREVEQLTAEIKDLSKKLTEIGGKASTNLSKTITTIGDITNVLDAAKAGYRDDQKQLIAAHATKLFKQVSQDTDYDHLQITSTYGLEIVHKDGEVESGRSSGYEHIIALCLVGALQKLAAVNGPVVMDTPFGRLDYKHGDKVIRMLPDLASQVLLLVTDREMKPGTIGDYLKDEDIIAQKIIVHPTSRESHLVDYSGSEVI